MHGRPPPTHPPSHPKGTPTHLEGVSKAGVASIESAMPRARDTVRFSPSTLCLLPFKVGDSNGIHLNVGIHLLSTAAPAPSACIHGKGQGHRRRSSGEWRCAGLADCDSWKRPCCSCPDCARDKPRRKRVSSCPKVRAAALLPARTGLPHLWESVCEGERASKISLRPAMSAVEAPRLKPSTVRRGGWEGG